MQPPDTEESLPEGIPLRTSQARPKRSKVQSYNSCRKHKTRCEILDSKCILPRCHRYNVLKLDCSHANTSKKSATPPESSLSLDASVDAMYALGVDTRQLEITPRAGKVSDTGSGATDSKIPVIWSFVRRNLDWSAPILAMQELARQPLQEESSMPVIAVNDQLLSNILTQLEIEHLLTLFSVNYSPWLNFHLIQDGPIPFLNLVCCTVASRHLSPSTRSLVAPRLQKLTEDTIARVAFNPQEFESEETIQGLIILSLWMPICGSAKGGGSDGRMLIGMAVTMAMNLRLNEAVATANSLRNELQGECDREVLEKALNSARLWMTLSTTESMLCVGTSRTPLSRRSAFDLTIFPVISPSNTSDGRDLRIRLLAEIFDSTERGLTVQFASRADMDTWFTGITNALSDMDKLSRLISPLSVVSNHDRFYYHMFHLLLQCCRLLVPYHAIVIARHVASSTQRWFLEIQPHDLNIIPIWSKECISLGEAIMVSLLQSNKNLLPTAPDVLFAMMAFAGGLIVGAKLLMLDKHRTEFLGCGDALLEQSIRALGDASVAPDHAAGRCSALMGAMYASWVGKRRGEPEKGFLAAPSELAGTGLFLGTEAEGRGLVDQSTNMDIFQDLEFWSTFFGEQMGTESTAYFSQDGFTGMYV
ncbi:uncharacterized protein BT62DRAFT_970758 [Guyanagaster necrorhizus]|uniref:Xylanolytic transcriptional activator regulatory domain-containing protein n=1 Tax=Guyanagaster necrorhizus TaxID=856835 RepID=A0A9P8AR85_9AGAR|nr:uncharacterized protein BT62DRAFT_970758 [Guyanagaster necrorhizus MCA 3950]KAG7444815.1 hypothetical protein BT62DRAFT_970758 [Guyanagaster necrorhizus MCA 3950]